MPTARAWRAYPQRYRYEAAVCDQCGKWHFTPRLVCDACRSRKFTIRTMQRTGAVLTYTTILVAPAPFADQAPYVVAVVEMDDGPRITTQVVDCSEVQLQVGLKVKLEFRRVTSDGDAGPINYGYKAVPV